MSVIRRFIHGVTPSVKALSHQCRSNFPRASTLYSNRKLPTVIPTLGLRTIGLKDLSAHKPSPKTYPEPPRHQETVVDNSKEERQIIDEVISKVNSQIQEKNHGRLFAIIHLVNKQWKITPEDIVIVEGYWPPNVGDTIRLEKVLLVGSSDFTLVGMPLLRPDLVHIQATVIEKRLSHTKTHFKKKRRKQYRRINFYRYQHTMLRINSITLTGQVNEKKDVEGIEGRIF